MAAILAAAYVIVMPPSADLAAHLFRAEMFERQGFAVWNDYWYSGNAVLSYSVLFPAISATLTPQLAAGLAATASAAVFTAMAWRHFGEHGWLGAMLFGLATAADLYSGRLTFAFGALPALAAVLALDFRRPRLACGLAMLSALCSPVAALYAAIVAGGFALGAALEVYRSPAAPGALGWGRRPGSWATLRPAFAGLAVIFAATAPVLLVTWMFPQGGSEPFAFSTMWPVLAVSAVGLILLPRERVRLRCGVALYALGTIVVYVIPTPIGSNMARMGTCAALPLAALLCWRRRPRVLALACLPLLYMGWSPAIRDGIAADVDSTTSAAYFAPLRRFLTNAATRPGAAPFRTEIPFTQFHWESYVIASRFSLARGWERQLDIRDNPIFYRGTLTAATYERWLRDTAVRFVAISDAAPDYSGRLERRLINGGLAYLHQVFRSAHWRVYQVVHAVPIVQGPARLQTLGPGSLTLRADRPGSVIVHLRFTPYWALARGSGCVEPDGSATRLTVRRAGEVHLITHFSLARIGAVSPRCR